MAQFTAHLAQFVVQVGVVAGDDGEAVDGIEAVQQVRDCLMDPMPRPPPMMRTFLSAS